jgi:hypothetical protein
VRRSLLRTGFGDALEQRERQLAAREATPVAQEPAHRTEPVEAEAPASDSAATPEPASEPMPAGTPLVTSDPSPNGPRDYGWPAQS